MVGRNPAQIVAITLLNPPTRFMLGGVSGQNRQSQSSPRMSQHLMRSWRELELGQGYQVFQGKGHDGSALWYGSTQSSGPKMLQGASALLSQQLE